MKTVLNTVFVFCMGLMGLAQDNTTLYKQEIGINIAPLIIPLYAPDQDARRFELTYARSFKSKMAFRFKLSQSILPGEGVTSSDAYSALIRTDTIFTNGTATQLERFYQNKHYTLRAYFSVEQVQSLGSVDFYYGLGIVPGMVKNSAFKYVSELTPDGNVSLTGFKANDLFKTFMLGVSPHIGIKVPLSKRLFINFQTGVEVDYHFSHIRIIGESERIKKHYTDFVLFPVMTEFGLFFRF